MDTRINFCVFQNNSQFLNFKVKQSNPQARFHVTPFTPFVMTLTLYVSQGSEVRLPNYVALLPGALTNVSNTEIHPT